ncbi:GmrSD restriction endonuclease domain-containing protein [Alicyclobacillus acidoterrestris]|uniref:GmrSD restriction endonuclease domain-containing protein n=1 Tax=Alicyclobacillus acidoterrestris TaxID=1450 RepID=UPI003F53AA9D
MSEGLTIRQIIELSLRGQIRIPAFQRGFVWDATRVAYLMDSIYKGYPFGSLLFWRTKEPLKTERQLGPFLLPEIDPDYPIDYVLDGQQRLTSIFGVFQTELIPEVPEEWTKIYFDFRVDSNVKETQFLALEDEQVDPDRHFPLRTLFDTTAYRRATRGFDDAVAEKIDQMQSVFKEVRIPIQTITTEDRGTVAIIFERVNRLGVELDTLQLLSAWTWSEEFTLQDKFQELGEELSPFGFKEVGDDVTLLLRCCAAIIGQEASPDTLIDLDATAVRHRFAEIENGVKGAIDFLRDNLNVYSLNNLPFTTLLVPLSVFFAVPDRTHAQYTDDQRRAIIRWFWKSCFSRRYSSGVLRNLKADIEEMKKLRDGEESKLGSFNVSLTPEFFKKDQFRVGNVNTKSFILALAQKGPLSFVTGAPVSLRSVLQDYNKNEFHHIYPRAYLERSNQAIQYSENSLANFCFLSKSDNVQLGGRAPSEYRDRMPTDVADILERSLCPDNVFDDSYEQFVESRSELLSAHVNTLML